MTANRKTEVFAHRGFSAAYPENTLVAFIAALELGVDGLEVDVHLSKDGEMVIIHDEYLNRTTNGDGLVANHTLAELKSLDAGSWFNERFAGQQIPTLEEVLDLIQAWGEAVTINLEIKSGPVPYPGLEEKLYAAVNNRGLLPRVIFSSFNHFALQNLKTSHPDANIGLLYMEGLVDPWLYAERLQAQALHPFYLAVDEALVKGAHEHGLAVRVFTVDDKADVRRMQEWGVDAIVTNRANLALETMKS